MTIRTLGGAFLVLVMPAVAQAGGGFYLGASVGLMDADIGGFDEATNAGALLGYEFFNNGPFYISAETGFTTTVSDGDVKVAGVKGDWDIDTRSLHLAARIGDTVYVKVRYGVVWSDVSVDVAGTSSSNSDSSGSWGGALGWNFTQHWAIQADGTLMDSDVTYWNLSLNYRF